MIRECVKCNIVFTLGERIRCLYCDSVLLEVNEDEDDVPEGLVFDAEQITLAQIIKDHGVKGHGKIQYVIGSYFRLRTFHFMYVFSRNEFKMGPVFKRTFIQPLNYTVFLTLPWLALNLLDSLAIRLYYNGYCEKCNWKFKKFIGQSTHNPVECEYNREYSAIIDEILSGHIGKSEEMFEVQAHEKITDGKKSAYRDLCAAREYFSGVLDVATIWFSVCLMMYAFIALAYPITVNIVHRLNF